jgi:hypothetical protein
MTAFGSYLWDTSISSDHHGTHLSIFANFARKDYAIKQLRQHAVRTIQELVPICSLPQLELAHGLLLVLLIIWSPTFRCWMKIASIVHTKHHERMGSYILLPLRTVVMRTEIETGSCQVPYLGGFPTTDCPAFYSSSSILPNGPVLANLYRARSPRVCDHPVDELQVISDVVTSACACNLWSYLVFAQRTGSWTGEANLNKVISALPS